VEGSQQLQGKKRVWKQNGIETWEEGPVSSRGGPGCGGRLAKTRDLSGSRVIFAPKGLEHGVDSIRFSRGQLAQLFFVVPLNSSVKIT
jgi:hypothetical protein